MCLPDRATTTVDDTAVTKTVPSAIPPRTEYRLTPAGEALRPVNDSLARWGIENYPDRP